MSVPRCWLGCTTATLFLGFALTACATEAPPATPLTFHQGVSAETESTTVRLAADACRRQPYGATVSESAEEVRIALSAAAPAGNTAASCSDLVRVSLKHPIGCRALVDASTGRRVPVAVELVGTGPQVSGLRRREIAEHSYTTSGFAADRWHVDARLQPRS
ncbi:hypothetical protein GCM10009721_36380 [Terrabacter tumescens]|uniref:Lipoprotein n=1 Tax=Terrabacter tumescens TaxID=60443 RepID=A0ABQ2IBN1_9MICO|nr:hypothetical protein GCM10009721_36380 [Terrabacter tumescens]